MVRFDESRLSLHPARFKTKMCAFFAQGKTEMIGGMARGVHGFHGPAVTLDDVAVRVRAARRRSGAAKPEPEGQVGPAREARHREGANQEALEDRRREKPEAPDTTTGRIT